jgi:polysaccharide pyruvyl transferase CsaB
MSEESTTAARQKSVLALGYYGFGNVGDEAILAVLLADLRAVLPGWDIVVVSGSPEETAADYGVTAILWQDVAGLITAAERADLLVLGGGGLIQDYNGFELEKMFTPWHGDVIWGEFALLARMWSKPLAIYGIGVGPLTTPEGRRQARLVFEQTAAAAVRDRASLELTCEIGVLPDRVLLAADPVYRLGAASLPSIDSLLDMEGMPGGDFTLGVCLRPWRDGLPAAAIADALDRLVEERNGRIVFLPFQSAPIRNENDAHASLEVLRHLKHTERAGIVRGAYGPAEKLAIFSAFDLVLAIRLHAAMFGIKAGVPTVALSYDPKVRQMMEEVGLNDQVLDLDAVNASRLHSLLKATLTAWPSRKDAVAHALAGLRSRSDLNRQALSTAANGLVPMVNDQETFATLARIARARAADATVVNSLQYRLTVADQNYQRLDAAFERLAAEHGEWMDSRAMRLARGYWQARDFGRRTTANLRKAASRLKSERKPVPALHLPPPERVTDPPDYGGDPGLRRNYTQQLTEILESHPHVVGYAVLPHSIGWKTSLFQRPQQMALALARQGYLVFYGLDHVSREDTEGFRPIAPGVYLSSIEPPLLDVLKGIPRPLALTYVYNYRFTRHLQDPVTVFEHIDELEVFTATHPMEYLVQWYEDAITGADIVAASARDLLATVHARRPDAVLCPNGVDYYHFARHALLEPPDDLLPALHSSKPIIGYYGALAEWVDYELLDHAAARLPQFGFVFIGPNYDGSMDRAPVFRRPNVWWLGPKEYTELPAYLHHFAVATIPFLVTEVTHAVSPLKLFEYMAGGKPIVTTAMRESQHYEVVLIAHDRDDWVRQLVAAEARSHDEAFVAALRRTARANTWDQRVGTLIDAAARAGIR